MNITEYLEKSGKSASALAKNLGVSPAIIFQWRTGIRPIPVGRCIEVERVTNGAVTRRDLRPKDWHLIWPELADPEST